MSWLLEKSEYSCYDASRLVDKVKELPISERDRQCLFVELYPLLNNLTKVVAHAYEVGDAWRSNFADLISDQGTEGFKTVMHRIREHSNHEGFIQLDKICGGSLSEPV